MNRKGSLSRVLCIRAFVVPSTGCVILLLQATYSAIFFFSFHKERSETMTLVNASRRGISILLAVAFYMHRVKPRIAAQRLVPIKTISRQESE